MQITGVCLRQVLPKTFTIYIRKYKRIHVHIYYTVHNSQIKEVQGSYLVDHSSHPPLSIVPPVLARAEVSLRSRDWVTCQRHLPSHEEAYVRRYLWSSVTLGGTGAHWSMRGAQLETRGGPRRLYVVVPLHGKINHNLLIPCPPPSWKFEQYLNNPRLLPPSSWSGAEYIVIGLSVVDIVGDAKPSMGQTNGERVWSKTTAGCLL